MILFNNGIPFQEMQLTTKDVSKLLNVTERTLYRWVNGNQIPHYKILDQYRFNKLEIIQWAAEKNISVSPEFISVAVAEGQISTLHDALRRGGIHYRLEGISKTEVLANAVEMVRLPDGVGNEYFLKLLMTREELESTGIGDGIAIPHPRNSVVVDADGSMISLFFLDKPIDYASLDGKPVDTLFLIVSQSPREHLHLLSRLVFALKDEPVRGLLHRQAPRNEIFEHVRRLEERFPVKKQA